MTFAAHVQAAPAPAGAEVSSKKTTKARSAPSRQKTTKATKRSAKTSTKSSRAAEGTVGFPLGDLAGLKKSVAATKAAPSAGPLAGGNYHAIIQRYATSYGVPLSLAHAVVRVESNYRADARGRAGEIGLMQIKPATARMMGYSGSAKGLFDPETNIKYGMLYLAKAHQLGGGALCQTILKYNAGHAAKRMNPVSAAYCVKVKRLSTGL